MAVDDVDVESDTKAAAKPSAILLVKHLSEASIYPRVQETLLGPSTLAGEDMRSRDVTSLIE